MKRTIGLAVLAALFLVRTCLAGPLWAVNNDLTGISNDFLSAAYGHGLFVAVGSLGSIFISTNGYPGTWSESEINDPGNELLGVTFQGVTYGNGLFVAVGTDNNAAPIGVVGYSTDGETWNFSNYAGSSGFTSVTYGVVGGQARFVAVGLNGGIITSLDGTNWTAATYAADTPSTNDDLRAVICADDRFVAVGDDDESFNWSGTGPWNQGGSAGGDGVAYGNDQFVSVDGGGNIYDSPDGINWTLTASTGTGDGTGLGAITYGNGMFVAAGANGTIVISVNGTCKWTQIESDTTSSLYGITYGNGTFLAVGFDGIALSSMLPGVASLPVDMGWSLAPTVTNDLASITYNSSDDRFLAVGGSSSFFSPRGIQWSPGANGLASADLTGVAAGNTRFVAVDYTGNTYISSDGTDWTYEADNGAGLSGIAYGAGRFVAVGPAGNILTASSVAIGDIPWTSADAGVSQDLNAVAFCYVQFVAVGAGGIILTSSDGGQAGSWTVADPGTNGDVANLYGVTYGDGEYVAVGLGGSSSQNGTILASPDGQNWSIVVSNAPDNTLRSVAYGNGLFVAVGDNGWTEISRDGLSWIGESSATTNNLESIVCIDGTFVAVGNNGTIMESVTPQLSITPLRPLLNHMMQISVTGGANQTCEIQDSTYLSPALVNWTLLATVPLDANGTAQYTDPTPATNVSRFYRAIGISECQ